MGHSQSEETTSLDEQTLQAWEDMRAEVLHELDDGGDVPDSLMDVMGNVASMLDMWRAALKSSAVQLSSE